MTNAVADETTQAAAAPAEPSSEEQALQQAQSDSAAQDASAAAAQAPESGDGASAEADDAEPDFAAELASVRNVKPETLQAEAPKELPGKSLDDVAYENWGNSANTYRQIMQLADVEQVQPFMRDELGLAPAEAQALWQKIRPLFNALHQNNEGHNLQVTDFLAKSLLTPEEVAEYEKRSYDVKQDGQIQPLSSRKARLEAAITIREERIRKEYADKLAKGELLTKAEAEKVGQAMYAKGVSRGERNRANGTSGQRMNSEGGGQGGTMTAAQLSALSPAEYEKVPPERRRAIFANGEG